MTSFYSWRQFLMTFHGRYRGLDHQHLDHSTRHAHDEPTDGHDDHDDITPPSWKRFTNRPLVMLVPLALLALGAVFAGMAFFHYFIGEGAQRILARLAVRRPRARKANCRSGSSWRR